MTRKRQSIDPLVRQELTLLRALGRDRRTASTRLTPVIRSGPFAIPEAIAGRPPLRRERPLGGRS